MAPVTHMEDVWIGNLHGWFSRGSTYIAPVTHMEDVWIGNLHGWFLQGSTNKIVMICHGNAGNITFCQSIIKNMNNNGYSVLIFDYSGYGQSKGGPSETGMYHDGSMFLEYLIKTYPKDDIVLFGYYMGASVAEQLAVKYNMPTLIMLSPLPSIKSLMANIFSPLKYLGSIFYEFDTESLLKVYKGRSLILHSKYDEIIPYEIICDMKKTATQFMDIEGSHNNPKIKWVDVNKFILKRESV
jgi:alpha/beta superfamily hydrolase